MRSPNDVPNDPPNDLLKVLSRGDSVAPRGVIMSASLSTINSESQIVVAQLGDLPPKPPRSKLEPHRELIRELRRKGRTYREVAQLFHERLGLRVAPSTLHSFVKVRAKHRKREQFELPAVGTAPNSPPELDRIAALKAKSLEPKPNGRRFVFRENESLRLTNRGGDQ